MFFNRVNGKCQVRCNLYRKFAIHPPNISVSNLGVVEIKKQNPRERAGL